MNNIKVDTKIFLFKITNTRLNDKMHKYTITKQGK